MRNPLQMPCKCWTRAQHARPLAVSACECAACSLLGFLQGLVSACIAWCPRAATAILEEECTEENRNKEVDAVMLDVGFARLHRTALGLTSLTRAYRLNPAHSFVLCCQRLTSLHYLEFDCRGWAHPQTRMRVIPWHGSRPLKLKHSFCICS